MARPSDDAIDFKPFFDMVVGVLFILLILISAQMFFSQWPSAPSPAEAAAREAEARRARIEADAGAFLTELAEALRAAGFSPVVDRLGRSVSVPAAEVLGPAEGGRVPANRQALARFAPAVLSALRCVAGAPRPEACRSGTAVRLARMDLRAQLAGSAGTTPDGGARLTGLELAAALFSGAPDLLSLAGTSGTPAVPGTVGIEMVGAAPRFVLDFAFAGPDMQPLP
jgi:hypothetical protein